MPHRGPAFAALADDRTNGLGVQLQLLLNLPEVSRCLAYGETSIERPNMGGSSRFGGTHFWFGLKWGGTHKENHRALGCGRKGGRVLLTCKLARRSSNSHRLQGSHRIP